MRDLWKFDTRSWSHAAVRHKIPWSTCTKMWRGNYGDLLVGPCECVCETAEATVAGYNCLYLSSTDYQLLGPPAEEVMIQYLSHFSSRLVPSPVFFYKNMYLFHVPIYQLLVPYTTQEIRREPFQIYTSINIFVKLHHDHDQSFSGYMPEGIIRDITSPTNLPMSRHRWTKHPHEQAYEL